MQGLPKLKGITWDKGVIVQEVLKNGVVVQEVQ